MFFVPRSIAPLGGANTFWRNFNILQITFVYGFFLRFFKLKPIPTTYIYIYIVHRVSPLKYSWDHRAKICYGYYIHIQYIYTAFLKFPRKTFQNISFYSEFFQKKICIWHWHTSPHVVSIVSIFPMPIMRSSSSFNIFHWFLQFFKN